MPSESSARAGSAAKERKGTSRMSCWAAAMDTGAVKAAGVAVSRVLREAVCSNLGRGRHYLQEIATEKY